MSDSEIGSSYHEQLEADKHRALLEDDQMETPTIPQFPPTSPEAQAHYNNVDAVAKLQEKALTTRQKWLKETFDKQAAHIQEQDARNKEIYRKLDEWKKGVLTKGDIVKAMGDPDISVQEILNLGKEVPLENVIDYSVLTGDLQPVMYDPRASVDQVLQAAREIQEQKTKPQNK